MPNYVRSVLVVIGENSDKEKFMDFIRGKNGLVDFEEILPLPENSKNLHDWKISNWGSTNAVDCIRNREDIINSNTGTTVILMFSVKNEAGMLAKAIGVIGNHGLSMNALRSRPLKSLPWQYYFYAEIAGKHASDKINEAVKEMSAYCEFLKILGASRDNPEL